MMECKWGKLLRKKTPNGFGQIRIKFTIVSFHFVSKQDCPKNRDNQNSTFIPFNCRDIQWFVCTEVLKYGTNIVQHFPPFSNNLNSKEKLYKDYEQFTCIYSNVIDMIFLD